MIASRDPSQPPRSESLPRSLVIRRRTTFEASRLKGRRVSNRWMSLNILPRDTTKSGETATVAFLSPKRLGGAVQRNQIRRRMREIYRRHLMLPDETAHLVWVARPPLLDLDFEGIKRCMSELIQRRKC